MKPIDIIYPNREEVINNHECIICGGDANHFRDAISKKEYSISGMCQTCQDRTFVPQPDDPCECCKVKNPESCKECQI